MNPISPLLHNPRATLMKSDKRTLLIVDDDEDDRLFLKKAFQSLSTGYSIHALPGGNEAVDCLKGNGNTASVPHSNSHPVSSPTKMPDGDGFTILEFLKNNPALSVIPVVMLSDPSRSRYASGVMTGFSVPSATSC